MLRKASTSPASNDSSGCGGWIVLGLFTLFGLAVAAAGLCIAWKSIQGLLWEEVHCVIERFEIKTEPAEIEPFSLDLRYRYTWQGREFIGTQLVTSGSSSCDFESLIEAQAETEQMADTSQLANARANCRVNPKHPEQSALLPDVESLYGGLLLAVFGSCFAGTIIGVVRSERRGAKPENSQRADNFVGLCFCGVFLIGGIASAWFIFVQPMMRGIAAKQWTATPATVIWSKVKTHSGSKGSSYSVDIFYRYTFNGRAYRSNRWGTQDGSSSGSSAKQKIVAAHPAGSAFTCYVNPQKPWQALGDPDPFPGGFWMLFPLPFLAIGGVGTYASLRQMLKRKSAPAL